jgi:hypothetical protein
MPSKHIKGGRGRFQSRTEHARLERVRAACPNSIDLAERPEHDTLSRSIINLGKGDESVETESESSKSIPMPVRITGRRIVDLNHLSEQLQSCKQCGTPLHLHMIEDERRYGFASILYIRCCKCNGVNKITTGKRHRVADKKRALVFDINTKAALGKLSRLSKIFCFRLLGLGGV